MTEIIDAPDPIDGDTVAANDIARQIVANTTGKSEHEDEKTDTIPEGLSIQYLRDRSTSGVIVLTNDKPAQKAIQNVVTAQS